MPAEAPKQQPTKVYGNILPLSLPPRGISRVQAAAYIGVSTTLFDEMIADGRMPQPRRVNTRTIWDVRELDSAFDALPNERDENPWDQLADGTSS